MGLERTVWHNNKFINESEAKFSIYDSALMFGDMAFEMMRTFNKKTFRLEEHITRLMTSLKILEIDIPYRWKDIRYHHENLILHNRKSFSDKDEIRTLINVSRGLLPMYEPMGKLEPNVIIACFPLRYILKGMSKYYLTGVHAIVPSQRAIPQHLLDPRVKSRSRQHLQMANLEVKRQDPEAWALLIDGNGFVTEGTGSNFFIVSNNRFELYTPKPVNCLKGISRDYVMNLARKLGMEVIEKDITLHDVYTAREAFFTNTPYSIIPVTKVNGKYIDEGRVGKRTKYLTHKWSQEVNCNFVKQSEVWDES